MRDIEDEEIMAG